MTSDESDAQVCQHHDAQVGVDIVDLETTRVSHECDWCGGEAVVGLVKSLKHRVAFCGECRDVIKVLSRE